MLVKKKTRREKKKKRENILEHEEKEKELWREGKRKKANDVDVFYIQKRKKRGSSVVK